MPDVGGDITVASFNLLNFFTSIDDDRSRNNNPLNAGPTPLEPRGANDLTTASSSVAPSTQAQNDPLAEFNRQVDKLVAAISEIEADIFGLIELENEFGDQNGDGEFAIGFLVDELNAAIPGANYQFVDPGQGFIDTGDAISVGLIYDANTVAIAEGTDIAILTDSGLDALGVNPGVAVFDGPSTNRAPLAVTFEENATGETFTVAVNHFKSKGTPGTALVGDEDIGDGVGNANQTRLNGAIALDAWLDSKPTGTDDDDVLIIGDLNAYGMEDPIQYLLGAEGGYEDQVQKFLDPGEFEYSFGFPLDLDTSPQVQAFGALDYALASSSLSTQVTGAVEWHINADEASAFDYNLEFKPQEQADSLFAPTPFRASDHDPVIIGLDLSSDASGEVITGTNRRDTLTGTEGDDLIDGLLGRDIISGAGGNDTIIGGLGADDLTGGAGSDTFVYGRQLFQAADQITDFEANADFIDLSDIFDLFRFSSETPFADYIQLVQDGPDTILDINVRGDFGSPSFRTFATLEGVTATDITASNFITESVS